MFSRRFIQLAIIATIASVLLPAASYAAKGGGATTTCTPIAVRVTIVQEAGSVLAGDGVGDGSYKDGDNGVYAKIASCGTEPNYNSRMSLPDSGSRFVWFAPDFIAGSDSVSGRAPAWKGAGAFQSKLWVTVYNLLWGRMQGQYIFTTRAMVSFIKGPGDPATYDLRIEAPSTMATPAPPLRTDSNSPSIASSVRVQDVPGDCRDPDHGVPITPDVWNVTVDPAPSSTSEADPAYVGTLYNQGYQKTRYSHAGQFRAPFKLRIEALDCVPAKLTMPPITVP